MRQQGDSTEKEQPVRLQILQQFSLPAFLLPTTALIIFGFLISSLGVQPVLWESLADSPASGKQSLGQFWLRGPSPHGIIYFASINRQSCHWHAPPFSCD